MTEETTIDIASVTITADDQGLDSAIVFPVTPSAVATTTNIATPSSVTSTSTTTKQQDETITLLEEEEGTRADLEKEVRSRDTDISGLEKLRLEKKKMNWQTCKKS
mmetsp:Transcript_40313/g.40864  ORF Transcript_40313/g.40864 Transcript_40313/m.40864 type:complete len:106 (+) Transcript_40313:28-345(+)